LAARLHITLLGSPVVTLDGKPVTGFVSNKAQALVYYLAATGQSHGREMLAGLLWSDVPNSSAKKNLRDVLSNLRKLLAPFLNITRQTVSLDETAGIFIDCQAFTATLLNKELARSSALTDTDASLLRDVTDLYRSDFLAGFYADEAPLFEEWMLGEREHLRQLALQALTLVAGYYIQHGQYTPAIEYTMRLLAMDPWREEAHRQLMLLLAQSGQRSAALAQYEKCRRILDEELGVEPAAETTALYEQIRDDKVARPALSLPQGRQGDKATLAATDSSPLLPRSSAPLHNLPAQLAPFVGRETEVAEVITRLKEPAGRLLTLVGPGGVGKTRLALQAGHRLVSAGEAGQLFPHGVYFVSMTGVEPVDGRQPAALPAGQQMSPSLNTLIHTIADALKLSFSGRATPDEQLLNFLRQKEMLLILDNLEHVLVTAHFLVDLLQQAPGIKFLATSRVRLNVRGEQLIVLGGLAYPNEAATAGAETWSAYEAIQLFLQRATVADPTFTPTAPDKIAISRICRLVDGLPLGIELAAGWVRLISCQEIAQEIEQNLSFLQSAMRDLPPRHQSLHAVFDYSWRLLTPAEKRVLRRLSVFRGGFSREAAVQVAGASLPVLAALIDNSLLRQTATHHTLAPIRYELLEVLRQYVAEKMVEAQAGAGEENEVKERHARFYLDFLQQRSAALQESRQQEALAEIRLEIENIRAAWRWAVTQGQAAVGHALEGLALFYYMRSWFQEGEEQFSQAAACLAERPDGAARLVWGKLLAWQGWFTFLLGRQVAARALLRQSLDILRPDSAPGDLVYPLNWMAVVTFDLGAYEAAIQLCQQGLAVSRASGYRYGIAIAKNILSQIAYAQGQYRDARRYSQESLAVGREIGNRWSMAFSLTYLGEVAYALGDYQEAQARFQEGLAIREAMGDARGTATCLNHLGDAAVALGTYAEAGRYYHASLATFREIGNHWSVAASLTRLGRLALTQGDTATAWPYFREALRTAYEVQATPPILDTLIGIASLLVNEEAEQARDLATVVWQHPETRKESREEAADLLKQLDGQLPAASSAGKEDRLADTVEALLYRRTNAGAAG
jgi:DNA-binding SARP family transcriptional activator/predicted ATPase